MKNQFVLGVDIGGSHITTGFVDIETRSFVEGSELRSHVNSEASIDEILGIWASVIQKAFHSFNISFHRVGIAMPGPFNYNDGISLMEDGHKYGALYGINIREELSNRLTIKPDHILFRNDAEAFLEGEVFCGAAANCNHAIGLTLGTGLGSAIHKSGVTTDANWWCSAFENGIAEDVLSTRWFVRRYNFLTGIQVDNVQSLVEKTTSCEMARQVFREFGENLSSFLNSKISEQPVDRIVLGGNIAKSFQLFKHGMTRNLKPVLLSSTFQSKLGELAALVGGASMWYNIVNV